MAYFDAARVLTKKNVLLSFRDSGPLIVTISSAFLSMLILYFSQISINNGEGFDPSVLDTPNPPSALLSSIPRCVPIDVDRCWTIAYVPNNDENVARWVSKVAEDSDIPESEVRGFPTGEALNEFLFSNPNSTQAAYIFEQDSLTKILDEKNIEFFVQYNETKQTDFPLGDTDFHARVVLPNMIHAMNRVLMPEVSGKDIDITIRTSPFPHPPIVTFSGDDGGLDAFGRHGPLLMFATYFLTVVFFLYKIVLEKERGLRDAMKLAGQYQSQHFISWCLPFLVFMFLQTMLLIAFGHAFGFKYFTVHQFPVYFLTFFIFGLATIGWTMCIATLTRKAQSVSIVSFNLFILGYLLASSGSIVYTLEDGEPIVGDSALFLRKLFAISPATMFFKSIFDGTVLALQGITLDVKFAGEYSEIFPITDCWIWMICSGLVAFALAIYLDNVLPSEHGTPLSPFYPFMLSYWNLGKRKANVNALLEAKEASEEHEDFRQSFQELAAVQTYDPEAEDADVREEREAVARGARDSAALVIKNFTKDFKETRAVDDISFSVKKNTAFALLGHNGAGKSTLMKMLVSSLTPTHGDAFVYGLSVRHEKEAVRKLLGVCPQFDIFWDKLTGAEHIEVFAALKGYNKRERKPEIEERLADVHLTDRADSFAGEYSGGMQRRLSVALALTGSPKILALDECTSGADPLLRRELWSTIERAKKGRVVFMITHSIAEAQHLAGHNAIGIMAKGKLRVLGNAMRLKTKFGAGYRLLAVLRQEECVNRLGEALNAACPGTSVVKWNVGQSGEILAEYAMPRHAQESEVVGAVQALEERREELEISDYSLNSATLGEVFKSITSLSEDVHETEDEEEKEKRRCWRPFVKD